MTSSTGFVNVLVDSEVLPFNIEPPVCNVYAQSLTWESFAEQSDWSGPMVATYSGVVTAEQACTGVVVSLRLKDNATDIVLNKTAITPTKEGTYTYKFTGTVEVPNEQGWYKGVMLAYDESDESDKDSAWAPEQYWDPPCYLDIVKFDKTGETTRHDGTKAEISYKLGLAQHGDNACRDSQAKVSMTDANGVVTFVHYLQQ